MVHQNPNKEEPAWAICTDKFSMKTGFPETTSINMIMKLTKKNNNNDNEKLAAHIALNGLRHLDRRTKMGILFSRTDPST